MRRHRVEYDGALYHVIQRSNNREKIFGSDSDKKRLIDLTAGCISKLGFRLFGYAIMDNHYHLLLQTGSMPLNKVMHRVNYLYSMYYNRSNDRHGHVFGGRYKAALIHDESYLFAVLRYIHQNPVRAGICSSVSDYAWSSDRAYRANDSSFVHIDFILNTFSQNRPSAIKTYSQMMGEEVVGEFEKTSIYGDQEFIKSHDTEMITENSNLGVKRRSLEEILSGIGASAEEIELIRSGSRKRSLRVNKRAFALKAAGDGYTQQQIGDFISISDAAVNKLIS
jgi:putative transposase